MAVEQGIFTSEFLEKFGELTFKEFADKYVSTQQFEQSQQTVETTKKIVVEPTETEETVGKSSADITEKLSEILVQIQVSNRKDEIIDNLHQELQEYKKGLKDALIAPLLNAIVREYDRASKQYRFYLEKSQAEPQLELFGKLLSEFEILSSSLVNLLSDYDIEPFEFHVGDALDTKLQNIEVVETENPLQDGTVADCVACGFLNIEKARLFRKAEVRIYKLKKQ